MAQITITVPDEYIPRVKAAVISRMATEADPDPDPTNQEVAEFVKSQWKSILINLVHTHEDNVAKAAITTPYIVL